MKSPKGKASRSEQQEFTEVNEQRSDEDNAAFWLFKQALRQRNAGRKAGPAFCPPLLESLGVAGIDGWSRHGVE